jgi:hypothetical protein
MQDEPVEELRVLDRDRAVGAEKVLGPLDVGIRCAAARDQLRRVHRDDVEDHERHERDREKQHARPQQSPDDVLTHGTASLSR